MGRKLTDEERKDNHKASAKKYRASAKGITRIENYNARQDVKASKLAYYQTPDQVEKKVKYRNNPKNKKTESDRRKTPKARARKQELRNTPEQKLKMKIYSAKPEVKNARQSGEQIRDSILKIEVYSRYSKEDSNNDIPCCACCGYDDIRFLTLDHIKPKSQLTGKLKTLQSMNLCRYLKKMNYPKDVVQVLCWNCNSTKGEKEYCPHELDRMDQASNPEYYGITNELDEQKGLTPRTQVRIHYHCSKCDNELNDNLFCVYCKFQYKHSK